MCGRYAITLPPEAVRAWFAYKEQPNFPPRHNIAPTQPIPIVCRDPWSPGSTERHFRLVRWGFVPAFAKAFDEFPLIINARAEGIADKASFRTAMIRRRCLVIADGWYEWRREGAKGAGTPFLFRHADGVPIAFAGLWESWSGADGSEIDTACIVTTMANAAASAIHPRMPVILDPSDYETWLDAATRPDFAARLLRPAPEALLSILRIGPAINKTTNDDASVQAPVGGSITEQPAQGQLL